MNDLTTDACPNEVRQAVEALFFQMRLNWGNKFEKAMANNEQAAKKLWEYFLKDYSDEVIAKAALIMISRCQFVPVIADISNACREVIMSSYPSIPDAYNEMISNIQEGNASKHLNYCDVSWSTPVLYFTAKKLNFREYTSLEYFTKVYKEVIRLDTLGRLPSMPKKQDKIEHEFTPNHEEDEKAFQSVLKLVSSK